MQNPSIPKPEWLTLSEAVAEICAHGFEKPEVRQTIHSLLQEARISSRCRCRAYYGDDNIHHVYLNKYPNIWTNVTYENVDFNVGFARIHNFRPPASGGLIQKKITDILLCRADVLRLFSISQSENSIAFAISSKSTTTKKPRTGAKRMPIWDYMWAEMARRAISGEWSEDTKQAQAINQMSQWLSTQLHDVPSDDSIKNRVSMLWNVLGWSGNK